MRARLEFRRLGCSSADSFRSVEGNHKYSSVKVSNKHGRTSSESKYWNAHLRCGSSSCCCCVKILASLLVQKIERSWRCSKNENYNALTELARCCSLLRRLVSRLQSDLMIDFCTHTHSRGEWWSPFNIILICSRGLYLALQYVSRRFMHQAGRRHHCRNLSLYRKTCKRNVPNPEQLCFVIEVKIGGYQGSRFRLTKLAASWVSLELLYLGAPSLTSFCKNISEQLVTVCS